ncbi:MAG TPA: VWA domain-containing protein [Terriglobales bacterium]|nr:VWA domain-containing protein [Terriglobales bacterium]
MKAFFYTRRFLAQAALLGLLCPLLPAQTPAPSAKPAEQPQRDFTFKVTSDLVLVNVVARDKKGNLITDLKREDFTLLEDSKPQKISSFDIENTEMAALPEVVSAAPADGGPAQAATEAKPKAPTASINLKNRRLIVLFFDFSGMEEEEIVRAVEAAQKYLDQQMTAADTVAITSFSSSLIVNQDFTADRGALKKALARFTSTSGEGFQSAADADSSGNAFAADDSDFTSFNTDRKLQALQSLAKGLARIEQKKSIIYFSNGVSSSGLENQSQLRATVNEAVKANVAIYTMDVRGLQALPPGGDASTGSSRGTGIFTGAAVQSQMDANFGSQETLTTLAADTGGKAFLDSNDFNKVFDRVQQDTSAYYVLSFRSANPNKDGRYRKITVKSNRPDLRLEYRSGYYAGKDFAHSSKDDREEALEKELNSELPATDVAVYMAASYFRRNDGQYYVPVSIVVPGSEIPFTRSSDVDKASLDIIGVVRLGQTPIPVASARETVKLNVQESQNVKRKNVQYNTGFILAPGTFHLKFVVRENQTGRIGSFETDITVPDLRKQDKKNPLKMSSVVLSGQVQLAGKNSKDNPLVRDGKEMVPNITHVFAKDQHLYMYYEVYDPAKAPKTPAPKPENGQLAKPEPPKGDVRVMSSVQFFNGKVKAFETPLMEVRELSPERRAAAFQLDVPLTQLKPGYYTCQVTVVDDAAGTFSFPRFALLVK